MSILSVQMKAWRRNTPSIRADHRALSCSSGEDLPFAQPLSKWMQNVRISPPLLINWGGNYARAAVRPDASELCSQSRGGKLRLTNTECAVRSCSDNTGHIWYRTHLRLHQAIWTAAVFAVCGFLKVQSEDVEPVSNSILAMVQAGMDY